MAFLVASEGVEKRELITGKYFYQECWGKREDLINLSIELQSFLFFPFRVCIVEQGGREGADFL